MDPRAGLSWCGRFRPPHTGIRSPDRPARSELSRPTSINLIHGVCSRLQHLRWLYRVECYAVHNKNVRYDRCHATIQVAVTGDNV